MSLRIGIDIGSTTVKVVVLDEQNKLLFRSYERHFSKVREKACEILSSIAPRFSGQDIRLVITGSAGLGVAKASGIDFVQEVYATAAAVNEYIPDTDAVIELVDTLAASAGEGMVVYDAVARRDAGMAIDENAAYTRAHLQEYAHWFTVDDLHFLKRGGRCSPSAAFFGTMLKIKPVLHVDSEGRLIARSKVRGRMQALRAIAMKFGELEADKDQMIFISHGDCEKDAMVVKETLVKEFGCDPERIILSAVGPVIGSHSGPGTVALFFRGKDRG